MKCPKCGTEIESNYTFCPECGTPIEQMTGGDISAGPVIGKDESFTDKSIQRNAGTDSVEDKVTYYQKRLRSVAETIKEQSRIKWIWG